jgi:putative toxin-antitoxin system antitoxin component (TIGR02293 family)
MAQTIARRQSSARASPYKTAGASLGLPAGSTQQLIRELRRGLSYRALEFLSGESGIPVRDIAVIIGIPERTLARRKVTGRLAGDESERLLRISRIFEHAVGLFGGDVSGAVAWLRAPRPALGGHTPLEYAATEVGAREVENLIGQLEYGVFP